ncbi:MAG: 5-formyltetrahydrofolate cyclo-ligase [Clostridia bacterium]|nr:5-formyltetrahydrofolate cyclo-ligase [Clostridia bacterium]
MKKDFRKKMLQIRSELNEEQVREKSKVITETLLESHLFHEKSNIMLYMDFRNEVKTSALIEYVLKHHHLILPKVDMKTKTMTLHWIKDISQLVKSKFGILEPTDEYQIQPDKLDLILAPGVAFDKEGYRLGYGGGFYDRLLEKKNRCTMVIALAFDCQVAEYVPKEDHDFKMDAIITESKVMIFNNQLQGVI